MSDDHSDPDTGQEPGRASGASADADLMGQFAPAQITAQRNRRRRYPIITVEKAPLSIKERRELQALTQEQALFDRQMRKDRWLFPITIAMAWTAYVLLAFNICVALGLSGLASPAPEISMGLAWGQTIGVSVRLWLLHGKRSTEKPEPTTRPPVDDRDDDEDEVIGA